MRRFVIAGLAVAGLLACFAAPFASSFPDGLERVAEKLGFIHLGEREPALAAPIPEYEMPAVPGSRMPVSVAGMIGVLVTFGAAYGLAWAAGRAKRASRVRR